MVFSRAFHRPTLRSRAVQGKRFEAGRVSRSGQGVGCGADFRRGRRREGRAMSHDTRIAVAVIHGMGSQGDTPQDIDSISFSAGLYNALRGYLRPEEWNDRVVYREVFWADVLQGPANRLSRHHNRRWRAGREWPGFRDAPPDRRRGLSQDLYSTLDPAMRASPTSSASPWRRTSTARSTTAWPAPSRALKRSRDRTRRS
jgi:hypothetical protein